MKEYILKSIVDLFKWGIIISWMMFLLYSFIPKYQAWSPTVYRFNTITGAVDFIDTSALIGNYSRVDNSGVDNSGIDLSGIKRKDYNLDGLPIKKK